jgi:hypothetical protein
MGYIVETKQDAVAISVLQTAENILTFPPAVDQGVSVQASAEQKAEVYFQIED